MSVLIIHLSIKKRLKSVCKIFNESWENEKQILLYSINGGLIATAKENHGPMINVTIAKDLYR